ncbi:MAG: sigma-70 family RNA polymerase sigma factor [Desulfobacterales bacterium]|nr:sigma-70 family RNA polymerase sigma factor [Desulfobacterales bacterium]
MAHTDSEYWKKQIHNHWNFLNNLALKRFSDANTADEAMLYVIEKLEENNWERVRKWKKKSSLKTYLSTVAWNLMEDFSRSKFRRQRPPKKISNRGNLYEEIYHRLCLERMSPGEIIQSLAVKKNTNPAIIEEAIAVILAEVPDYGKHTDISISIDIDNLNRKTLADLSSHHLKPEDLLASLEFTTILEAMAYFLTGEDAPSDNSEIRALVTQFRSYVKFNPEECLFLRMIYQDGLKVSPAGRKFGWNADKAQGKHRRLLKRIKKAIEKSGLDIDSLKAMLK